MQQRTGWTPSSSGQMGHQEAEDRQVKKKLRTGWKDRLDSKQQRANGQQQAAEGRYAKRSKIASSRGQMDKKKQGGTRMDMDYRFGWRIMEYGLWNKESG